jgi:hypothetical protein
MTVTAHNVLILSLVVVCLALVWRFLKRHGTSPGHDLRLAILLGGTLAIVPCEWASGVTAIDADMTLIVSRGIGMKRADAPRMRFLCRPEWVIVDLVPEA